MRRKFSIISVIVLVVFVLLAVLGFVYWQQVRQNDQIKTPLARPDQTRELIDSLNKSGMNLQNAPLVLDDTITASISGFQVLFTTDSDLETQVRALQLVLPRLTMDGKNESVIDLRFNKVIVR